VALDVLEVLESAGDLPAVDGLSGLAGVLERDTEVGAASAGALGGLDFGGGVTDLNVEENMVRMVFCWWWLRGVASGGKSEGRSGANRAHTPGGNIPS
jgi:hypothetical protein